MQCARAADPHNSLLGCKCWDATNPRFPKSSSTETEHDRGVTVLIFIRCLNNADCILSGSFTSLHLAEPCVCPKLHFYAQSNQPTLCWFSPRSLIICRSGKCPKDVHGCCPVHAGKKAFIVSLCEWKVNGRTLLTSVSQCSSPTECSLLLCIIYVSQFS